MRVVAHAERSADEALALADAIREQAQRDDVPILASSLVRGPLVLLGAHQRAGRVIDLDACARTGVRVLRRGTSGPAAYVGVDGALLVSLALPAVNALAADARMATLLNRNVRGFLKGFSTAGIAAHYFGRDTIAFAHRPGALLGVAVGERGAVSIDVVAGVAESFAVRPAVGATAARSSREPTTLREQTHHDVATIAERIADGHARRWSVALEPIAMSALPTPRHDVTTADDPFPSGSRVDHEACAIGWLDGAIDRHGALHFGGDAFAATHTLAHLARDLASDATTPPTLYGDDLLEGARPEEFVRLAERLRGAAAAG